MKLNDGVTYNPYGEDTQPAPVRPKPVSGRTILAVNAGRWAGRRAVTRLSPFGFALLWPVGTVTSEVAPPKVIVALGLAGMVVTYAVQRHATTNDARAQQWALRTTAVPAVCTAWVMLWWWLHSTGRPVWTVNLFLLYLLGCVGAWSWLYTASHVGTQVAWERAQRDFRTVAKRVGLVGAKVVEAEPTRVGSRVLVDVRGTGADPRTLAVDGKLANAVAGHDGLAPGKAVARASQVHAGFLELLTYRVNPWADPVPHPGAPDYAVSVPVPFAGPFPIGIDPETGKPLTMQLANADGAIHTVIVSGTGGGKTNLLNVIIEHLTRVRDGEGRPLVNITLIDPMKGLKDAANWTPAVSRVYGGPDAIDGALGALQRGVNLISERAAANGKRGRSVHALTAEEPAEVFILDEAHSLLGRKDRVSERAVKLVNLIQRGGRGEMVCLILATQRGLIAHLGSSESKANAMQTVVMPVKRTAEQAAVLPDWQAEGMPDMSVFGDRAKGCALVAMDGDWQAGRTFELHDLLTIREISMARCLPEHRGALDAAMARAAAREEGEATPVHLEVVPDTVTEPPVDDVPVVEPAGDPLDVIVAQAAGRDGFTRPEAQMWLRAAGIPDHGRTTTATHLSRLVVRGVLERDEAPRPGEPHTYRVAS